MFNVVLFEPEIPSNTGNIGRTCVVTGSRLHLIGPLGFSLGDDMLRRAGLGYWHSLDVTTYAGWEEFLAQNGLGETDESTGLPEELLARAASRCERIPMLPDAATLKDAGEWAARVGREQSHEALRQDVCGNFVDPDDYRISALNLSNSAAIVLYEALRQTDFQGM